MSPMGNTPAGEMPDGKISTQSYAIIRHWSRMLGAYEGKTEDEKYWADGEHFSFPHSFPTIGKKIIQNIKKVIKKIYLDSIETHLESSELSQKGPFINGTEITYADLALYQLLHDESLVQDGRRELEEYPRLVQLVDAVEGRLNIKEFLCSDAYLG
ncbi:hypothetical protein NHQ30_009151 [Ciborinia camelliae]|nr:hypothetical protein NHQ30_009151 [Ciborinia camelliae]